jgi:hypothetical protein
MEITATALHTSKDVVAELEKLCEAAGGPKKFAASLGVSYEQVRIILLGKVPPTGKVLEACGFKKMVFYEKV